MPSEVEGVLQAHPDVTDVAVVGVPTKHGGEKVVAVLVLRSGAELDTAALEAWCRERLAPYKVPRVFVSRDDLPRSMLGKVLRKQVREEYLASQTS
jgi:long-chain acyl-CoA synthetase